jgi:hypothetical protein
MRIRFLGTGTYALCLLAIAPAAQAQYYGQQPPPQGGGQSILYDTKKNQPPAGMVIEQGNAPSGIPTSGVQQQQQLTPKSQRRGPTTYYKDPNGLTVINGPNGTTVCRDISGRVTVCN